MCRGQVFPKRHSLRVGRSYLGEMPLTGCTHFHCTLKEVHARVFGSCVDWMIENEKEFTSLQMIHELEQERVLTVQKFRLDFWTQAGVHMTSLVLSPFCTKEKVSPSLMLWTSIKASNSMCFLMKVDLCDCWTDFHERAAQCEKIQGQLLLRLPKGPKTNSECFNPVMNCPRYTQPRAPMPATRDPDTESGSYGIGVQGPQRLNPSKAL